MMVLCMSDEDYNDWVRRTPAQDRSKLPRNNEPESDVPPPHTRRWTGRKRPYEKKGRLPSGNERDE